MLYESADSNQHIEKHVGGRAQRNLYKEFTCILTCIFHFHFTLLTLA